MNLSKSKSKEELNLNNLKVGRPRSKACRVARSDRDTAASETTRTYLRAYHGRICIQKAYFIGAAEGRGLLEYIVAFKLDFCFIYCDL